MAGALLVLMTALIAWALIGAMIGELVDTVLEGEDLEDR